MVFVYSSAAHLKNEPVIELHEIHFLPSVRSTENPHDLVRIEQVYDEVDGEIARLVVCSECCTPKITIYCGGQLEISSTGTICKNFDVYTSLWNAATTADIQIAIREWQRSVDLVARIIRSLILDRFDQEYLNKVIQVEESVLLPPSAPVKDAIKPLKIVFRRKPRATKVFSGRLACFVDALHPELFKYRHSKGCLYSLEPELNIQDPDGSHQMAKVLHMKLCNGAYVNIEGFVLGMTKSLVGNRNLGAYDTPVHDTQELLHLRRLIDLAIADENGMISRGFLATASAETLAIRKNVIDRNGKDYWMNVIHPPIFHHPH